MKTNLEPLNKTPLSNQLFKLTGKGYNSLDFEMKDGRVFELRTDNVYILASKEEEDAAIALKKAEKAKEEEELSHKYDHIDYPFIDLNNRDRWRKGLNAAQVKVDGKYPVIEMCEDAYWHFLECVPPAAMESGAYLCGEPYCHNSEGKGVFLGGIERNGKWFAQYGTVKEFRSRQMFK